MVSCALVKVVMPDWAGSYSEGRALGRTRSRRCCSAPAGAARRRASGWCTRRAAAAAPSAPCSTEPPMPKRTVWNGASRTFTRTAATGRVAERLHRDAHPGEGAQVVDALLGEREGQRAVRSPRSMPVALAMSSAGMPRLPVTTTLPNLKRWPGVDLEDDVGATRPPAPPPPCPAPAPGRTRARCSCCDEDVLRLLVPSS